MSLFDAFKYDGVQVVVVGAATGMGNAVAHLVQEAGYFSSGLTESFPPATGITTYLSGRT